MTSVNIVTYSDADFTLEHAAAIDVYGNPLHMHVRKTASDETVWLDLSTANGSITITDGTPDVITLYIAQAKLLNLPPGEYVHSLIMTTFSGLFRVEIWRGTLTHNVGPTRWAAGEI